MCCLLTGIQQLANFTILKLFLSNLGRALVDITYQVQEVAVGTLGIPRVTCQCIVGTVSIEGDIHLAHRERVSDIGYITAPTYDRNTVPCRFALEGTTEQTVVDNTVIATSSGNNTTCERIAAKGRYNLNSTLAVLYCTTVDFANDSSYSLGRCVNGTCSTQIPYCTTQGTEHAKALGLVNLINSNCVALAVEYALVLLVCGTDHGEFVHHFCQIDIGNQLSIILGIAVVDLLGKPYQLLG